MISHASQSFRKQFQLLPASIQAQAREAYRQFQRDPNHPSLHFEKLRGHSDLWSVRITLRYRAVAVREGEVFTWFWIGSHADFDRDFA